MDVNKRFNNAIQDVISEIQTSNWKRVIEATFEIAGMIKSSGHGDTVFKAVMENLEIQIKVNLGQKVLDKFHHVIKHHQHYKSDSVIILPPQ